MTWDKVETWLGFLLSTVPSGTGSEGSRERVCRTVERVHFWYGSCGLVMVIVIYMDALLVCGIFQVQSSIQVCKQIRTNLRDIKRYKPLNISNRLCVTLCISSCLSTKVDLLLKSLQ